MPALAFCIPGDIDARTGGYLYDARMTTGLTELGWQVATRALDASFPLPSAAAQRAAADVFLGLPDGAWVLIDGLALPGLTEVLIRERVRLRLIGLIHHPVALETGLDPGIAARLADREQRAFGLLHGQICTSEWTARLIRAQGASRVRVAPPGTDRAPRAQGSRKPIVQLLSIATITPRKGHALLIDALAELRELDWHLHCVGSLERDPACVTALRTQIADRGLETRVTLHGELAGTPLDTFYAAADVFVLASQLEGYGMAIAEALVRGLPIVTTRAGAIPDLVPDTAGRLVAPDDIDALADALAALITDADLRRSLGEQAYAVGSRLPDWPAAAQRLGQTLHELAGPP